MASTTSRYNSASGTTSTSSPGHISSRRGQEMIELQSLSASASTALAAARRRAALDPDSAAILAAQISSAPCAGPRPRRGGRLSTSSTACPPTAPTWGRSVRRFAFQQRKPDPHVHLGAFTCRCPVLSHGCLAPYTPVIVGAPAAGSLTLRRARQTHSKSGQIRAIAPEPAKVGPDRSPVRHVSLEEGRRPAPRRIGLGPAV